MTKTAFSASLSPRHFLATIAVKPLKVGVDTDLDTDGFWKVYKSPVFKASNEIGRRPSSPTQAFLVTDHDGL